MSELLGNLRPKSTDIPLRPCPFCGAPAALERNAQGHLYRIQCMGNAREGAVLRFTDKGCGVQPCVESGDRNDVAAAWNRREPDWQAKWEQLVEDVSRRTDQAKGKA